MSIETLIRVLIGFALGFIFSQIIKKRQEYGTIHVSPDMHENKTNFLFEFDSDPIKLVNRRKVIFVIRQDDMASNYNNKT